MIPLYALQYDFLPNQSRQQQLGPYPSLCNLHFAVQSNPRFLQFFLVYASDPLLFWTPVSFTASYLQQTWRRIVLFSR